jgi:hypothetical protein
VQDFVGRILLQVRNPSVTHSTTPKTECATKVTVVDAVNGGREIVVSSGLSLASGERLRNMVYGCIKGFYRVHDLKAHDSRPFNYQGNASKPGLCVSSGLEGSWVLKTIELAMPYTVPSF